MTNSKKIIVSSKQNLEKKYGKNYSDVIKLLSELIETDKQRELETQLILIDDKESAAKGSVIAVSSITAQTCKKAIDEIYKKISPEYLVIFGAADIIPFQSIDNPVPVSDDGDEDKKVPSDLPYACDKPFSTKTAAFTGPTRVIGRIPDIEGIADIAYLKTIFKVITTFKPLKREKYTNAYFSLSASVWVKSTSESLSNIFGNSSNLKSCPPNTISYTAEELKPMTHFYNCHGGAVDSRFYGQKAKRYPIAMESTDLKGKITSGTIVASECCYGAELFNPKDEGNQQMPMSNTYFENKAIAFVGSSTIAYGPAEGQALADLLAKYFLINVFAGASTGRAFLEARQKFLSESGPDLDPYELKTLAQFYLLGDPSLHPVMAEKKSRSASDSIQSRRLNLIKKGIDLGDTSLVAEQVPIRQSRGIKTYSNELLAILNEVGFTGNETEYRFEINPSSRSRSILSKSILGSEQISFRTFVQKSEVMGPKLNLFDVLVIKESNEKPISWKMYHRK